MNGHQGMKPKPVRGAPPDLSSGTCVTHPFPDIWDADSTLVGSAKTIPASAAQAAIAEAKRICRLDCPVVEACLEAALIEEGDAAGSMRYGTRGGRDRFERAAMPRPRVPHIEHGTTAGYNQHARYGVPLCDACRAANVVARAPYNAAKRKWAS